MLRRRCGAHLETSQDSRTINGCRWPSDAAVVPRHRGAAQTGRRIGAPDETRYSSRLSRSHRALRLRQQFQDPFHAQRRSGPRGNLFERAIPSSPASRNFWTLPAASSASTASTPRRPKRWKPRRPKRNNPDSADGAVPRHPGGKSLEHSQPFPIHFSKQTTAGPPVIPSPGRPPPSGDPAVAPIVEPAVPRVTLRNAFAHPYDSAIAAARTCYATHLVVAGGSDRQAARDDRRGNVFRRPSHRLPARAFRIWAGKCEPAIRVVVSARASFL